MPEFRDIQKFLPKPSNALVQKVWESVPQREKETLNDLFKGIPVDRNPFNMLLGLAIIQAKMVRGRSKHVAIVGPANVGKSTLFNQLIQSKHDRAEVGPVPGTTRINQAADAGLFSIVDTPGADAVGYVGEKERDFAFDAASRADFLILMFDAIQGIKQTELDLYHDLIKLQKPYIIVLNKIDLTKRHQDEVLLKTAENLGVTPTEVLPISALKGDGITHIIMAVVASDPELTIALAQAMPQYRHKLSWRAIATAASLSAAIALTPLPVIDFIPLMATQTTMVLTIARIFNYKITYKRAKELIATFGLGMLGRTLFQQFSKAGGLPGWLLSSAIATSITVVMGYASIAWFEKGERISHETLRALTKKLTGEILGSLKRVFKKKPRKTEMEQSIQEILANTTISEELNKVKEE